MKTPHTTMLTGGTGYIGAWVTRMLLDKGYHVRLTVRDMAKTEKYAALKAHAEKSPGKLDLFEADLLKPGSYNAAAKGADSIIHMASPFTLRFKDAQKDLIAPAVEGTRNVLEAATTSGTVKKVVLTSSVAAVHGDNIDMAEQGLSSFDESHWNTTSTPRHQPYSYSKVMAEKEAWKMSKNQSGWKMVVINPSFVVGPALDTASDSESLEFMKNMLSGKFAMAAPELYFGYVDVRDVAGAHILALESSTAKGRHILAERTAGVIELAGLIRHKFGDRFKLPKSPAPKWLLYLVGWMFGAKPKFVARNVGYPIAYNNTKGKEALGLEYTPLEETLADMVAQMTKSGLV